MPISKHTTYPLPSKYYMFTEQQTGMPRIYPVNIHQINLQLIVRNYFSCSESLWLWPYNSSIPEYHSACQVSAFLHSPGTSWRQLCSYNVGEPVTLTCDIQIQKDIKVNLWPLGSLPVNFHDHHAAKPIMFREPGNLTKHSPAVHVSLVTMFCSFREPVALTFDPQNFKSNGSKSWCLWVYLWALWFSDKAFFFIVVQKLFCMFRICDLDPLTLGSATCHYPQYKAFSYYWCKTLPFDLTTDKQTRAKLNASLSGAYTIQWFHVYNKHNT